VQTCADNLEIALLSPEWPDNKVFLTGYSAEASLWVHLSKLIAGEVNMTVHALRDEEVHLLRKEVEMLMAERQRLLQVVGAAAVLVANLDSDVLPEDEGTIDAAEMLAEQLNGLTEETLKDALESVRAEFDDRPLA
jgi:hypothetical protein